MFAEEEEFEWEPPSEAELKVFQARRERQDKISKLMGDYLLKGYKMLSNCCDTCGVRNQRKCFTALMAGHFIRTCWRDYTL